MNAFTRLCKTCLAADVQVVATSNDTRGDLCEYCAKGAVHPAVQHRNGNGEKAGAARASSQIGKPRRSMWDDKVFNPLRAHPRKRIVLYLHTMQAAEDAASALRILNKSRALPGFRFSSSKGILTAWCETEKPISFKSAAARIREALQ